MVAFYAADTGVEHCLYRIREEESLNCLPGNLNGASYTVTVTPAADPTCDADNCCIKSVGSYKKTKRAIEITY